MNRDFFSMKGKLLNGKEVLMDEYKGKVIIIVNTASKCGLTPQYKGLQELYDKYKTKGLVILGFPCNQFANQEPGDAKSIEEICTLNYGVSFPMFKKVDVNGKNTHPIFKYLKEELKGIIGSNIKWNFTKFLLDKNGNGVKRFSPKTEPKKLEKFILEELEK